MTSVYPWSVAVTQKNCIPKHADYLLNQNVIIWPWHKKNKTSFSLGKL
jgi:hypothetical protein